MSRVLSLIGINRHFFTAACKQSTHLVPSIVLGLIDYKRHKWYRTNQGPWAGGYCLKKYGSLSPGSIR